MDDLGICSPLSSISVPFALFCQLPVEHKRGCLKWEFQFYLLFFLAHISTNRGPFSMRAIAPPIHDLFAYNPCARLSAAQDPEREHPAEIPNEHPANILGKCIQFSIHFPFAHLFQCLQQRVNGIQFWTAIGAFVNI